MKINSGILEHRTISQMLFEALIVHLRSRSGANFMKATWGAKPQCSGGVHKRSESGINRDPIGVACFTQAHMSEISWDCGRAPGDVALISIWMCSTTGFTCCASFAFFYLLLFAFCTRNRLFSPEQLKRKTESLWLTQQVQLCCGAGEDRWSIVWCCKPLLAHTIGRIETDDPL